MISRPDGIERRSSIISNARSNSPTCAKTSIARPMNAVAPMLLADTGTSCIARSPIGPELPLSAGCRTGKPASARWREEAAPGPWRRDSHPVRSKPCRRCIRIWGMRRQRPAGDLPPPRLAEARAPVPPASGKKRNRCMKMRSIEQGLTAPARPPALLQRPVGWLLGTNPSAWGCCSI